MELYIAEKYAILPSNSQRMQATNERSELVSKYRLKSKFKLRNFQNVAPDLLVRK